MAAVSSVFSAADATVAVALIGLVAAGLASAGSWWATLRSAKSAKAQRDEQGAKLEAIRHTVTVNGGQSEPPTLPDRIGKVEALAASLTADVTEVKGDVARLDARFDEIRELLLGLARR